MEQAIGEAAGKVWLALRRTPMPAGQLPRAAGLSVEMTNQAIGWLFREGKLVVQPTLTVPVLRLK